MNRERAIRERDERYAQASPRSDSRGKDVYGFDNGESSSSPSVSRHDRSRTGADQDYFDRDARRSSHSRSYAGQYPGGAPPRSATGLGGLSREFASAVPVSEFDSRSSRVSQAAGWIPPRPGTSGVVRPEHIHTAAPSETSTAWPGPNSRARQARRGGPPPAMTSPQWFDDEGSLAPWDSVSEVAADGGPGPRASSGRGRPETPSPGRRGYGLPTPGVSPRTPGHGMPSPSKGSEKKSGSKGKGIFGIFKKS